MSLPSFLKVFYLILLNFTVIEKKSLPVKNTLAYLTEATIILKRFVTLTPGWRETEKSCYLPYDIHCR